MSEIVYLDLEDLMVVSAAAIGSPPQVRDWGLLEAALARPRATVFGHDAYPDVRTKAAALLASLINNHALVDGNKRTALIATRLFLALNGIQFCGTDNDKFDLVLDVARDHLDSVEAITARIVELTGGR